MSGGKLNQESGANSQSQFKCYEFSKFNKVLGNTLLL